MTTYQLDDETARLAIKADTLKERASARANAHMVMLAAIGLAQLCGVDLSLRAVVLTLATFWIGNEVLSRFHSWMARKLIQDRARAIVDSEARAQGARWL